MYYDNLGLICSNTSEPPAGLADSCAETSREERLMQILGITPTTERLLNFITPLGYVRHPSPTLPIDWRENDFSSDQALPLYLALRYARMSEADVMKAKIKANHWRTGNGDLVSPYFFAALIDSVLLMSIVCLIGALVFTFPFRWSDSKKAFESSANATGDYLNYFHCLPFTYSWVRRTIDAQRLMEKIRTYYLFEADSDALLRLYAQAIAKVCNG